MDFYRFNTSRNSLSQLQLKRYRYGMSMQMYEIANKAVHCAKIRESEADDTYLSMISTTDNF